MQHLGIWTKTSTAAGIFVTDTGAVRNCGNSNDKRPKFAPPKRSNNRLNANTEIDDN